MLTPDFAELGDRNIHNAAIIPQPSAISPAAAAPSALVYVTIRRTCAGSKKLLAGASACDSSA